MAHKTLISGTAYSVTGGRELIGGTGYGCKAGKTLIGGTAFTVPFAKGIPLSTITPGAILMLNESGSPAQFCVAKHDYEADLNGAGLTLMVKKSSYGSEIAFGSDSTGNSYASSNINKRLQTYASAVIDGRIREAIRSIKIPITNGNGNTEKTTMDAKCFILSITELGFKHNATYFNEEGTALPDATELRVTGQWTRTPSVQNLGGANRYEVFYMVSKTQAAADNYFISHLVVPAFTLPGTTAVVANADGTYSLA